MTQVQAQASPTAGGDWRPDRLSEEIGRVLEFGHCWWFWCGLGTIILWLVEIVVSLGTFLGSAGYGALGWVMSTTAVAILGIFLAAALYNIKTFRSYGGRLETGEIWLTVLVFLSLVVTIIAIGLVFWVEPTPSWVLLTPFIQIVLAFLSPDVRGLILDPRFGW